MEKANDEAMPTAIVTGSTKGKGKATAELLTKRGHSVVICSEIKTTLIKQLEKLNRQQGRRTLQRVNTQLVIGLKCDVCNTWMLILSLMHLWKSLEK